MALSIDGVKAIEAFESKYVLVAIPGVAPIEWTPNLLREKGVHSAKNETTVRAGVPASNG